MRKKALILTWEKFQDHEVIYPFYALQEHGYEVAVAASAEGERINGILGAHVYSDFNAEILCQDDVPDYDLLCIPGGVKALEKLRLLVGPVEFVKEWFKQDKQTMVICNGPQLLITADVLSGRTCSGYYSIEPDIKNAGAEYHRTPIVDGNMVSCAHYDDMGEWMRLAMETFNPKT